MAETHRAATIVIANLGQAIREAIPKGAQDQAWLAYTDTLPVPQFVEPVAKSFFEAGWVSAMGLIADKLIAAQKAVDDNLREED